MGQTEWYRLCYGNGLFVDKEFKNRAEANTFANKEGEALYTYYQIDPPNKQEKPNE